MASSSRGSSTNVHTANSAGKLPWQCFSSVYCVNLDRRPERWNFMTEQFQRLRMPVQRWRAVDGKELDVQHMVDIGIIASQAPPRYQLPDDLKLFCTDLTDGGIGCALSHF